jgi:hypothetical protein
MRRGERHRLASNCTESRLQGFFFRIVLLVGLLKARLNCRSAF